MKKPELRVCGTCKDAMESKNFVSREGTIMCTECAQRLDDLNGSEETDGD